MVEVTWIHGEGYRQLAQALVRLGTKVSFENTPDGIFIRGERIVIPYEVANTYLHMSERRDGRQIWMGLVSTVERGNITQCDDKMIVLEAPAEKPDFVTIKIRRSTKEKADEWSHRLGIKSQAEFFDKAVDEFIRLFGDD